MIYLWLYLMYLKTKDTCVYTGIINVNKLDIWRTKFHFTGVCVTIIGSHTTLCNRLWHHQPNVYRAGMYCLNKMLMCSLAVPCGVFIPLVALWMGKLEINTKFLHYLLCLSWHITGCYASTIFLQFYFRFYTLAQRSWRGGGGVYWIHLVRPSVRPSVRLSVDDMVSGA